MKKKEKKSTAIKYNEYIIFGDPTDYCYLPYERSFQARSGKLCIIDIFILNFKKYHKKILEEHYYFDRPSLCQMFDFNESFVQKYMRKDFKMLFISKSTRDILKSASEIKINKYAIKDEEQQDIYKLALELLEHIDYETKIYYRKLDIIKWIKNNLYREVDGSTFKIGTKEALDIFNKGIVSNKTIKQMYGMKHNMQVTRLITSKLFTSTLKKYIYYNSGDKRPIIRYLIV